MFVYLVEKRTIIISFSRMERRIEFIFIDELFFENFDCCWGKSKNSDIFVKLAPPIENISMCEADFMYLVSCTKTKPIFFFNRKQFNLLILFIIFVFRQRVDCYISVTLIHFWCVCIIQNIFGHKNKFPFQYVCVVEIHCKISCSSINDDLVLIDRYIDCVNWFYAGNNMRFRL